MIEEYYFKRSGVGTRVEGEGDKEEWQRPRKGKNKKFGETKTSGTVSYEV